MQATIPDKRHKLSATPVVCAQCGYPEIVVLSGAIGKVKVVAYAVGPESEEQALVQGWAETEMGLNCPICAGLTAAQATEDAVEGAESHVGAGGMATALAQGIAESKGEQFEGQISDEQVMLPTVHVLKTEGTTVVAEDGTKTVSGVGICTRCGKKWNFKMVGDDYVTDPPYTRECILAPSTEHLPAPVEESTNE